MIALNEPLGGGKEKPKRTAMDGPKPGEAAAGGNLKSLPEAAPVPKPDSSNQFEVVAKAGGDVIQIARPWPYRFTKAEALNLAAWLAALADPDGNDFERLLIEILPNPNLDPGTHKRRHGTLHRALDELLGDWIKQTGKAPSKISVLEFLQWSSEQALNPT